MPAMDSAYITPATIVIPRAPGPMNMNAMAPPPASIGRYVSAAPRPPLRVSGRAGGDSSSISPRGSSGGGRRAGRRKTTVLTCPPFDHAEWEAVLAAPPYRRGRAAGPDNLPGTRPRPDGGREEGRTQ